MVSSENFGGTKPTSARFAGDLANARCGVVLDDIIPERMGQEALKGRDRATGNARTTGGFTSAPAFLSWLGGLPGHDVHLHFLDVSSAQGANLPCADQRDYVGLDPAAVHGQGRSLDRPVLAPEDRASFGILKIPGADLTNGMAALDCARSSAGSAPPTTAASFTIACLRACSTVRTPTRPITILRLRPSSFRY